jgi:hypothetical protein
MIDEKVFVVGLNKTATTSMHKLFMRNGLNSCHIPNWVDRINDPKDTEIQAYQCYSDGYAHNFEEIAQQYPNAVFILTTRSLRAWVISRFKHGYATLNAPFRTQEELGKYNWAYPPAKDKMISWIETRTKHHHSVLTYFKNQPSRLFLVNIEQPNWEGFVGQKLDLVIRKVKPTNVRQREKVPIILEIEELVDNTFIELGYDQAQINEYLIDNREEFSDVYDNNFAD